MHTKLTIAAAVVLAIAAVPALAADDGAALFAKRCAACHGASGKADTKAAASLKIKPFGDMADLKTKSADELAAAVRANDKHKGAVKGLSDEQLKAVVGHAKTLATS